MLNDITQELANYRSERLLNANATMIANAVMDAMKRRGESMESLAVYIDENTIDWARSMWDEAVRSAELQGVLVFGPAARMVTDLQLLDPVTFSDVVQDMGDRVALAILVLMGMKG